MQRFGVKFKLGKDGLDFSGRGIRPDPRKPSEMRDVVFDPDGLKSWKKPLYLMYRGVNKLAKKEVKQKFDENKIRYDLTFIYPGTIGPEYNRTHGHFHPRSGRGRYYGEIYEVLSGKAMFLLQHRKLTEFLVFEAEKGQGIFIPGEYGHITVNVGDKPLLLGNLVIDGFKSQYDLVKKKRGFAYYVFEGKVFYPNPKYKSHPSISIFFAREMKGLERSFLKNPSLFKDLLEGRYF